MSARKKIMAVALVLALISGAAFAAKYATATVEKKKLKITVNSDASLALTKAAGVFLPDRNATLTEICVSDGAVVNAGDVIARYTLPVDELKIVEAENACEAAKDDMEYGIATREAQIEELTYSLDFMVGDTARKTELTIEKLKMELEDFTATASAYAAYCENALSEAQNADKPRDITAPITGVVTDVVKIEDGKDINPDKQLAYIYDPTSALLRVNNADGKLKYGMEVEILLTGKGASAAPKGVVISADNVLPVTSRTGMAYISFSLTGLANVYTSASVTATALEIDDALMARSQAVSYENGHYVVNLAAEDGTLRTRYVVKALDAGSDSWLLYGVSEGDTLVVK